jgi:hypothetical protein
VSVLYVYAVLDEAPGGALGAGAWGETLRAVACGGLATVAGAVATVPAPTLAGVREHDAVIRRLAAAVPALLPARFGSVAADEPALRATIGARAATLRERLARVRGCEQMTLRVYGAPAAPPPAATAAASGTEYLERRRAAHDPRHALPALRPLLATLEPLVADERFEPHGVAPLLGTIHHLVDRAHAHAYLAAADAAPAPAGLRVRVSGPWAAYAFAGELSA